MAKALVNVKLKPKAGGLVSETYRDGTQHEGATCSLLTVFEGKDGKPPWVSLAPDVQTALKKGGFKIDDFYINVYFEGKSNTKRKVAADDADDIFGDDE